LFGAFLLVFSYRVTSSFNQISHEILEIENIMSVIKNATDLQLLLLSSTKTNKNEEAKLSHSTPEFNSISLFKMSVTKPLLRIKIIRLKFK